MKKLLLMTAAMAGITMTMQAEGYQVNTFSARQQGMGMTGVGQMLGSESLIFNPAAVSFMPGTMQISGSLSAISSKVTCTYSGMEYNTANKVSTPLNISAAFRINDSMAAGITFFTPYGSSINWGINWPGAALNQSVDLKVFTVQPTFSWRLTDRLSVGAGLNVAWGSVDLTKGLVSSTSFDALLGLMGMMDGTQYPAFRHVSPAYANLVGSSRLSFGFNVGALYVVNDRLTIGASFRSKLNMKVEAGDVDVNYANEISRNILESRLQNISYTNFSASMPCPYVLTIGASYRLNPKVLLAADIQLNGWSAYKQLDIAFAEQPAFDQHIKKDYHNAITYHLGAEVACTPKLEARAGLMIDTSPCNTEYYNPETPAATKIEPAVGLSFHPVPGLSIDLSLMYVCGLKVKGATGNYDDFIAPIYNQALVAYDTALGQYGLSSGLRPLPTTGTFTADYRARAIVPAIGISYKF